ncbi:MAG: hypothetical protein ACLP8X_28525 [Streptosporangiaceae bacterium]
MEYKVLSGPFTAGKLERDLNSHAAEGWRVAGTFQAISSNNFRSPNRRKRSSDRLASTDQPDLPILDA